MTIWQSASVGERTAQDSVHIIYGSATGLSAAGDEVWHQNRKGVKNRNEAGEGFGESIGTGDFDGSGVDDLPIGVPHEGGFGRAAVIYGTPDGSSADGNQSWSQWTASAGSAGSRFELQRSDQ